MPSLFKGVCKSCSHCTPIMTAGYGAVWSDHAIEAPQHEVAGAVTPVESEGEFALSTDPRLIVLRHPLESHILKGLGTTTRDLLREGRYVAVRNVVCRDCGKPYQRKRLAAPGDTGCGSGLLIGVVAAATTGLWRGSFLAALGGFFVVAPIAVGCLAAYWQWRVRTRFRARDAELAAASSCPRCDSDSAVGIERAKHVTCEACGERTVSYRMAGKS